MPRVGGRKGGLSDQAKLRKCLDALIADPEAACLGGNEFCCAGCGGNSDLVDSLCAFNLHSDAARQYFAQNGGIEALALAMGSSQEKVSLAALQILQCLCSIRMGQELVVSIKPALLHMVCKAAVDTDEDRESMQHAALMVLTQWASDPDSPIPGYLNANPPPPAPSMMYGLRDVPSTEGSVPALTNVALAAILHPVLAVRKAAAQLLANTAAAAGLQGGGAHPPHPAVIAGVRRLAAAAVQVLVEEEAATATPRFEVFANGNSRVMLDPLVFMNHQQTLTKQKTTCQALLQLVSELCAMGPAGFSVLSACPQLVQAAAQVFASAWLVSWQGHGAAASHPHATSLTHVAAIAAPFAFISDHQSREMALDCFVHLISKPGGVSLLAPTLVQQQQQQQQAGNREVTLGPEHEVEALNHLLQLVKEMLRQPSAGHVRAALTVLGHVKFQGHPSMQATQTEAGSAPSKSVHIQWMQLLCDVFDAAWESDQADASDRGDPTQGPQHGQLPAALLQFPQAPNNPPPPVDTQEPPKLQLELGLGYRVLVQVLQAWKHIMESQNAVAMQARDHTQWRSRVELAASHPKHLVASAAAKLMLYGDQHVGASVAMQPVLDAWDSFGLVNSGMPQTTTQPAAQPVNNAGSWGQAAFDAAVAAMGLGEGVTVAPVQSEDADMQEFLNVFLQGGDGSAEEVAEDGPAQAGLEVSAASAEAEAAVTPAQPPEKAVDMFSSWDGGDAAADDVLAEAMSLLPDLDRVAANTCVKYDTIPGFFPAGF